MQEKTLSFGLLVAYVLPGFILLAGIAPLVPSVAQWLKPVGAGDLGLGPPLYTVMAATAFGLILATFRWLILDHIHAWTGIKRPIWDDRQLPDVLDGFDYLVQNHFRYYEFFGHTLIAVVFTYVLNRAEETIPFLGWGTDVALLTLSLVLFAASRDALAKYYSRTGRLIGRVAEKAERASHVSN